MTRRRITLAPQNRAFLCIPAYLRDKYGFKKGSTVEVTDDGTSIVITPTREQ
ncbi:AbrB/MazE/SpoVT family DNA-binding domain-containing protein [Methanomethylovorans sp.]|uniref:AbrB/MazE/SpoVT family DNA-binding domain-containing protein n=1 Tax=Methanomethylovorans sp. TaxID=2758717 RepID=UPI002FDD818A